MSRAGRLLCAAFVAAFVAAPAGADDYKIGVLHVERILRQSAPAKAAHDRIEQEFKGRDADIAKNEQEVRDAATQLEKASATLSADDRAAQQRALEARTREVQRLREQFAEDARPDETGDTGDEPSLWLATEGFLQLVISAAELHASIRLVISVRADARSSRTR